MTQNNEIKRLERRAKALLLNKKIPVSKMNIVRSLMQNEEILPEERYSAVIELIKSCPEKPVTIPKGTKVELNKPQKKDPVYQTDVSPDADALRKDVLVFPAETSAYVETIYRKYKKLKLFKKRYLIHADNRLGIGIKKRLIPAKRLLRLMADLSSYQEKIMSRLHPVLIEILRDDSIQNPVYFNYLRIFRKWMMDTPLIKLSKDSIKWMDRHGFDSELKNYAVHFFSFLKLDVETREQILLTVENKLRTLDDLKKDTVNEKDSEKLKREKEKRNLAREKSIHGFMMIMRSFLPTDNDLDTEVSKFLKLKYSLNTFSGLLSMLIEVLVFRKEIKIKDLVSYYEIKIPVVSNETWDYSLDFLKKLGKDPATRRKKFIEKLKVELEPYEELYSLLNRKFNGGEMLQYALETQWKHVDMKKGDTINIYEEDFISFIDGCINFFANSLISIIDGTTVHFEDRNKSDIDGSVFGPGYFGRELNAVTEILEEIYYLKTNNPSLIISRDQAVKILNSKIRTMPDVERILRKAGSVFYQIGSRLQRLYKQHNRWLLHGSSLKDVEDIMEPLISNDVDEFYSDSGRPIPFYDYKIKGFPKALPLSKFLIGREITGGSIKDGLISLIIAFSYQIAYVCMNENITDDLENRDDLLNQIKKLVG